MSIAAAALILSSLVVDVGNIRNDRGMVRVSICPKPLFLADSCPYEGSAHAVVGTTRVTVEHVPPGNYAANAFHDENSNGKLEQGMFSIPQEGVGFSRDAPIRMSPPKWEDAVFSHTDAAQTIGFALRYFVGPANPAEWKSKHKR